MAFSDSDDPKLQITATCLKREEQLELLNKGDSMPRKGSLRWMLAPKESSDEEDTVAPEDAALLKQLLVD